MTTMPVVVEDVEESEQPAIVPSGQAQLVTILTPVDAPTDFDHTTAGDGATADPMPAHPPGRSAVAVHRSPEPPTTLVVVEDVEESEQSAIVQSGQAQHVTILMPVDPPTEIDHTTAGDGATADPPPAHPPGRSAVAVDTSQCVPMNAGVLEPNTGDTTDDTEFEDAATEDQPPELAVDADALPNEIEPRMVDLGWGILVGELSLEDFNEILSFPKLFPDHW